jgi:DNA-directed RNA polymerase specialized sigma24 family protein
VFGEQLPMRKGNLNKPVQANERVAALDALSDDQRKQLAAYARIMSRGTGDDGDDLLQGAFARWLASDGPAEGPEQTYNFLRGAISSIRSNIFRHTKVVRRFQGVRALAHAEDEEDPLDQAVDPAASTETAVFFQQVYDLCNGDEEIQLLLMAQLDNGTPAEVQTDLGWQENKYKAVQKRKKRLVARWMLEGKLR